MQPFAGTVAKLSHEVELKLEFRPKALSQLRRAIGKLGNEVAAAGPSQELVSTYFDSAKQKLRSHGISLRIRRLGKRRLQTIKWSRPALFDRGETETPLSGSGPDWKAARGTPLEHLLDKKVRRSVRPAFETRVRRTVYSVKTRSAEIELAVDQGSIRAGRRSTPVHEIELELKQGQAAELFRFARELSRNIPARLALKSKAERGYELLNGKAPLAVKAEHIGLRSATTAEAFRIIARSCLGQIIANEQGVEAADSESLHQMRVGVRRLRAAISLFSDVAAGPATDEIKPELKWITGELSPARDIDVYIAEVLDPLREQHRGNGDFLGLYRLFARSRKDAFNRAIEAIGSDRYRRLSIELAAWIEAGKWDKGDGVGELPIERYAAQRLGHRRKKIIKKSKAFEELDARQRHKLRIAVKKLRYGTEFVGSAFSGKRAEKRHHDMAAALKRVQDYLGGLNDIAVHEHLNREVTKQNGRGGAAIEREYTFLAGLVSGQEEARESQLVQGAAEALREFESIKPFWT
jgi:inorganic triphosphatase YgiF